MTKFDLLDFLTVIGDCSFKELVNHFHQMERFFTLPDWNENLLKTLLKELVDDGVIHF